MKLLLNSKKDSGMTLEQAVDQMKTTCTSPRQIELLERVLNPPAERELADRIPLYPPKTAKRESLCQLRWRHLDHVDSMARNNTPRAETMKYSATTTSIFMADCESAAETKSRAISCTSFSLCQTS
jgi:hypothetical protein